MITLWHPVGYGLSLHNLANGQPTLPVCKGCCPCSYDCFQLLLIGAFGVFAVGNLRIYYDATDAAAVLCTLLLEAGCKGDIRVARHQSE